MRLWRDKDGTVNYNTVRARQHLLEAATKMAGLSFWWSYLKNLDLEWWILYGAYQINFSHTETYRIIPWTTKWLRFTNNTIINNRH